MAVRPLLALAVVLALLFAQAVAADAPKTRYTRPAPGTVYDTRTGLGWEEPFDKTTRSWSDAKAYCAALATAGGGWRLPSLKELLSLVDVRRSNPAIDGTFFPQTPAGGTFWSSSSVVGNPANAWVVFFDSGASGEDVTSDTRSLRCVR